MHGRYVLADLLDAINGTDDHADALLDAYNQDRITISRLTRCGR